MVPRAVVTELPAVSLRAQPGGGSGRHEQPPRAGLRGPPLLPPPELLGEPCQFVPVHFPAGSGHGELRVSWAGSAACGQLRAGEEHPLPLLRQAPLQGSTQLPVWKKRGTPRPWLVTGLIGTAKGSL